MFIVALYNKNYKNHVKFIKSNLRNGIICINLIIILYI